MTRSLPGERQRADLVIGISLLAASVFLYWQTLGFRGNAALLPRIILIGMGLGALVLVARFVFAVGEKEEHPPLEVKKTVGAILFSVLYVALIPGLGFYLTSTL